MLIAAQLTLNLSPSYDLKMNATLHSENLRATSLDETTYYLKDGETVVDVTDDLAKHLVLVDFKAEYLQLYPRRQRLLFKVIYFLFHQAKERPPEHLP